MSCSISFKDARKLLTIVAGLVGRALGSTGEVVPDNRVVYKCGAFGCNFATFDADQAEAHKKGGKHGGTREPD